MFVSKSLLCYHANMRKTKIHLPISNEGRKIKIVPTQPVIFLAGPIGNAPHWHNDAIQYLLDKDVDAFIASPRRTIDEKLKDLIQNDTGSYEEFPRQRAWEQYYLYKASENGCIFFYLPQEFSKEDPQKVYAHITMLELGEWIARHKINPKIKMIVATNGNFPEWHTIKFELETEGQVPTFHSLNEGLDAVMRVIEE